VRKDYAPISPPPKRLSAAGKLERLFLFQPLPLRRKTILRFPVALKVIRVLHGLYHARPHHPQTNLSGFPGELFLTIFGLPLLDEVFNVETVPHLNQGLQLFHQVIKRIIFLLVTDKAIVARAEHLVEQVGHAYYLYLI
jgi:hypothetical protein